MLFIILILSVFSIVLNFKQFYSNILDCCTPLINYILPFSFRHGCRRLPGPPPFPHLLWGLGGGGAVQGVCSTIWLRPAVHVAKPGWCRWGAALQGGSDHQGITTNQCPALLPRCLSRQLRTRCSCLHACHPCHPALRPTGVRWQRHGRLLQRPSKGSHRAAALQHGVRDPGRRRRDAGAATATGLPAAQHPGG